MLHYGRVIGGVMLWGGHVLCYFLSEWYFFKVKYILISHFLWQNSIFSSKHLNVKLSLIDWSIRQHKVIFTQRMWKYWQYLNISSSRPSRLSQKLTIFCHFLKEKMAPIYRSRFSKITENNWHVHFLTFNNT